MKISFLVHNMYGIGGTVVAVAHLAAGLSEHHEVEIASVYRRADTPGIALDPRVRVVPLIDARGGLWKHLRPSARKPSRMFHDPGPANSPLPPTRLADQRIKRYLRRTDADVVIATRPFLVGHLARHGSDRYLRIGQEHRTLDSHNPELREECLAAVQHLDAYVTVSEADAEQWRAALPERPTTRVLSIPNAVPAPSARPSTGDSKTVVAAGRFIPIKRYDRLIEAFAKVAAERPDWQLRIYGRGRHEKRYRRQIERLGLYDRVRLMGAVSPIETEWAKGAIAAVASDGESFGMTLVEAMRCGVPVVSTDCPYGPGEIISHGRNGVLVPLEGGSDAFADALLRLIDDPEQRQRLGAEGLSRGADYDPARIAGRWTGLLAELAEARAPQGRRPWPGLTPAPAFHTGPRLEGLLRRQPMDRTDDRPSVPARAVVTPDGSLTVELAAASLPPGELELVGRRRRAAEDGSFRLPVPAPPPDPGAGGADPWVRVTVPRTGRVLPEGRWDFALESRGTDGGLAQDPRLQVQLVDSAALMTLPPAVDEHGVATRIPYRTEEGGLALRTWLRPAHAEAEQVVTGERTVTVTAALYGATGEPVAALARSRTGGDIGLPLRPLGDGRVEVTLPYAALTARLAGEDDSWELRLRAETGRATVPIGRIAGDWPDRRRTDRFPAVTMDREGAAPVRVRPHFTARHDLTVTATEVRPS
ncbi:glycosyltransferase family 4 protein [Streptomyces sp. ACA25]|uniref:glycosyltransferase family 4 protein n=1 Tax=Streptomyces sp. ACA25 TaxID=3022596 RepID=UPI002307A395|nr:glycosyltransferase family 4 protein [Streptomyces sp. ACA25]MDB1087973.1 glycosyltransferase family 4 protein [Streptomyces sp. ACA25]